MKYKAIVMGASAGGLEALKTILSGLPAAFDIPIIIVQHIRATSENYWIEMLDGNCPLPVREAEEKEKIKPGVVYVAPPGYHLLVERDKTFSLSSDEKVNYARPSIDVLFESAAFAYQGALIGIILTGANSDGTAGMQKIKQAGGLTIVQDPQTAEAPVMPASVLSSVEVDHILPLEKTAALLREISQSINFPS